MNRYHRSRHMGKSRHDIHAGVWLIGLAVLFFTGFWWPGILVLVGLSLVLQWVFSQASSPQVFEPERPTIPRSPVPPAAPAPAQAAPIVVTQAAPVRPAQALPSACPRCGGPVRAYEVKWTGPRSALCAYCGSALPLKKS